SPTSRNLNRSCRRRASAAPSIITRTPSSPPIASTAIRGRLIALTPSCPGSEPDGDDLATVVEAAMPAQIVRTLQFAAVRAFVECLDLQRIMRPAIAPAMRRYFSFRDSHSGTCSLKPVCLTAALGDALRPRMRGGFGAGHAVKARPI